MVSKKADGWHLLCSVEVGLCALAMMSAASACSLGPQMSSAACSGGAEVAPADGGAALLPPGGGATMVSSSSAAVWYAVSPEPELGSWAARAAAAYASGSAHCRWASSRVCGLQQSECAQRFQEDLCWMRNVCRPSGGQAGMQRADVGQQAGMGSKQYDGRQPAEMLSQQGPRC
jgi:hypothetical protein